MEKRTISIPFEIDQEFVDGVMSSAFCDGICYWCERIDVKDNDYKGTKYASEVIARGGTIIIVTDEEDGNREFELDLDKLIEGYRKYAESRVNRGIKFYTDPCDIDSVEADIIVQYAIFGEVIFG